MIAEAGLNMVDRTAIDALLSQAGDNADLLAAVVERLTQMKGN